MGWGFLALGRSCVTLCLCTSPSVLWGLWVPVDPCVSGVGSAPAPHICHCVHSLLASGTCLRLRVFAQERGCVCALAAQGDRGRGRAWRLVRLRALWGQSRAVGSGEVAAVPHSSVLLSRLPRGLSSTCSSHAWPWWWAELAVVGGLGGSGVGLMGSGDSSRAWSPPPGMSGSGVRWAATHSPHWSGSLPGPLPLSLR